MLQYKTYLACFVIGWIVTHFATPLVIRLALRLRAVDRPANRKIHLHPVPRLGGIGIFLGMWIPLLLIAFYDNQVAMQVLANDRKLFLILAGGLAMVIVGVIDDIRGLNAKWKFGIQFPVAIALVAAGARFDSLNLPLLGHLDFGVLGPVVSVLWLVGVTNALNLIDGIDGLATGVAYLIAMTLAILLIKAGQPALLVVMFSIAGACFAFLRYNFTPAKIFLGDSGSLFLGMTLAVSSTLGSVKEQMGASLIIPMVLLGYPITDTVLSMTRRVLRGKSPFSGDAGHIHHRLVRRGLDHLQASLVIYSVCLGFCLWTISIEWQFKTGMVLGTLLFFLGSFACIHYLGYLDGFEWSKASKERQLFRAAYNSAKGVRSKLHATQTPEEVFDLLGVLAKEFNQPALDLQLPDGPWGPGLSYRLPGNQDRGETAGVNGQPVEKDRYEFDNTRLVVEACFVPGGEPEELCTEKRTLFGEVCEAANHHLYELLRQIGKHPPHSGKLFHRRQPSEPTAENGPRNPRITLKSEPLKIGTELSTDPRIKT